MAEAIVSFAVERLGDLLIQEASFLHGVRDKVTEIQAELRMMQCFLRDADARRYESEVIRNWVAEIREAAYDTEDIIETYASKAALRTRRSGLQNNIKRYACFLSEFKALHEVGTEIDAIKSRISRLTASLQSYNIRSITEGEGSGFRIESQRLPRRTYSHVVDEDTVGVEDGVEILLEQLMKPDKICSFVSIYGMGGLGKTTLAKKVYHHAHVRRRFDHVAWSSISQYFNVRDVVQGILIQLTSANEEHKKKIRNMRDEELFESVYKIQEEKKCLLILDDMWKIGDWENLKPAFPLHKAGNKYCSPLGSKQWLHMRIHKAFCTNQSFYLRRRVGSFFEPKHSPEMIGEVFFNTSKSIFYYFPFQLDFIATTLNCHDGK
ncbi:putative disease resistance protein [Vitis vinifera]|uniref:Putative disease resistance protein n=1 Tax=Vitis vinifera TaxID=29760 RepID=A0A438HF22_VITVI|nr:putative disease resistance protein [Vitis vinifera]